MRKIIQFQIVSGGFGNPFDSFYVLDNQGVFWSTSNRIGSKWKHVDWLTPLPNIHVNCDGEILYDQNTPKKSCRKCGWEEE